MISSAVTDKYGTRATRWWKVIRKGGRRQKFPPSPPPSLRCEAPGLSVSQRRSRHFFRDRSNHRDTATSPRKQGQHLVQWSSQRESTTSHYSREPPCTIDWGDTSASANETFNGCGGATIAKVSAFLVDFWCMIVTIDATDFHNPVIGDGDP